MNDVGPFFGLYDLPLIVGFLLSKIDDFWTPPTPSEETSLYSFFHYVFYSFIGYFYLSTKAKFEQWLLYTSFCTFESWIRIIDDVTTTYQMRKYLETWRLFKMIRSDHLHRQFKTSFIYPVSVTATGNTCTRIHLITWNITVMITQWSFCEVAFEFLSPLRLQTFGLIKVFWYYLKDLRSHVTYLGRNVDF